MQPSTIFIPLFFILFPSLMFAYQTINMEEKIQIVCDNLEEFPTDKLGSCLDYGIKATDQFNTILLVIIATAIPITILLELNGRWKNPKQRIYPIMPITEETRSNQK